MFGPDAGSDVIELKADLAPFPVQSGVIEVPKMKKTKRKVSGLTSRWTDDEVVR